MRKLIQFTFFFLTSMCNAQEQQNGKFAGLPVETVFNISESIDRFTQLFCEIPGNLQDTIWVHHLVVPPMWKVQADDIDENINVINNTRQGKVAILTNASYPQDALKKGKEGKVEATCIVEKDGSLTEIKLVNSVFPSIDAEALRLISEARLLPCKIEEKTLRCRHKIGLLFEITNRNSDAKSGRVLIVNADKLTEGIAKRYHLGVTWTETTTSTRTDKYGYIDRRSWTSGSWHTTLNIDVPKNNIDLENVLCKTLYNKSGKSIEAVGPKFAKKFQGRLNNKDFKGKEGTTLTINAYCLSYKPRKYYSYGYETTLASYTIPHNIIYNIQTKKLLTIADILTDESIAALGLDNQESYDLGINEHFLYIGKQSNCMVTIGLTQENWSKFSPSFQALLGNRMTFPTSNREDDFGYGSKMGIQPTRVMQKLINRPSLSDNNNTDLENYLMKNMKLPDSIIQKGEDYFAKVSYIVKKDGTLSNVEIIQTEGETVLRDELMRIFNTMPKWHPLKLSNDGTVHSYDMFNYRLSSSNGEAILSSDAPIYTFVDQMPTYRGGVSALNEYLSKNLKYPVVAEEHKIQGRVFVNFVVEPNGSITNVGVARSVDPSLDKESVRVIKNMPRWEPGKNKGKKVRVKLTLPITFRL